MERFDYQSDVSEMSNITEAGAYFSRQDAMPTSSTLTTSKKETLFKMKGSKPSFLKRRKNKDVGEEPGNLFANSINKLTFGGLDKVSNSIDKIKGFVTNSDTPRRKKKRDKLAESRKPDASDSELEQGDRSPAPSPFLMQELAVPELQIEDFDIETSTGVAIDEFETFPAVTLEESYRPVVSFCVPPVENETGNDVWTRLQQGFQALFVLHREAVKGPWVLGPICTSLYDRSRLEVNLVDFLVEVFELRKNWVYVQMHYFVRPVLVALGGHVINRFVDELNPNLKGDYTDGAFCDL